MVHVHVGRVTTVIAYVQGLTGPAVGGRLVAPGPLGLTSNCTPDITSCRGHCQVRNALVGVVLYIVKR